MTTDLKKKTHDHIERIEQYETLAPGQFWRVSKTTPNIEENSRIDEGDLLLIESIGYADDKVHTVKVRYHPTKIGGGRSGVAFLLRHFLDAFEHVDKVDAEKERQQEINRQHKRINELQSELATASSNVEHLDKRVEEDIPVDRAGGDNDQAQVPVPFEAMGSNVKGAIQTGKLTNLISPALTANGINQIKSALNEHKTLAERRAKWLTQFSEKISTEVQRLTPFFEEAAAVALASTKDIRDHIADIMNSIDSLNLYVLKDVELEKLTSGNSAPATEPLTLCQRVLYADEEMAVFVDVNQDTFDFRKIDDFFEALATHQELVEQIFPATRCIVPMATTRYYKDYAQDSARRNAENKQTFLLVRDGSNLSVVLSPLEWHRGTDTLFPSHDDVEKPFRGIDGSEIGYDDVRYTDRLTNFQQMKLKYHQLLILLCGLDHKEQLFGDFYDGEPSLEFISKNFQERYFRFIHDADGDGLLADGAPRLPYADWVRELNEEARPGSRFLIDARETICYKTMPSAFTESGFANGRRQQFDPVETIEGFIPITARRRANKLMCSIPVSGLSYNYDDREFNASFNISEMMDKSYKGYLCLDRVTPEEIEGYLTHRPSRLGNITGIRLMKHALSFVREERKQEKPLRDKIFTDLTTAYPHISSDELALQRDKAIAVWKCAHPNKDPLTLLKDTQKYLKLCDQIGRMFTDHVFLDDILSNERQRGNNTVRVFVDARGNYVALSEPPEAEKDNRVEPFYWLKKTRYKLNKKSVTAQPSTFVVPTKAQNDGQIVYEVENVKDYEAPKEPLFLNPEKKRELLDMNPLSEIEQLNNLAMNDNAFYELVEHYRAEKAEMTRAADDGYIKEPEYYAIPIGVRKNIYYATKYLDVIAVYWDLKKLLLALAGNNKNRIDAIYDAQLQSLQNTHPRTRDLNKAREDIEQRNANSLFIQAGAQVGAFSTDQISENLSRLGSHHFINPEPGAYYKVVPDPTKQEDIEDIWFADSTDDINYALGAVPPIDYHPMTVVIEDSIRSEIEDDNVKLYAQAFDGIHFLGRNSINEMKIKRFDSPGEMIAAMNEWSQQVSVGTEKESYKRIVTAEETDIPVESLVHDEQPTMTWRLKCRKEDVKKK